MCLFVFTPIIYIEIHDKIDKTNPPPIFKVGSTTNDFVTSVCCCFKMDLGLDGVVIATRFIILPMKFMIMIFRSTKTTTLFVARKQPKYFWWEARFRNLNQLA